MLAYQEEHQAFRAVFKKFVEKELQPKVEEWEFKHEFPRDLWYRFGEQGFLCPWLPEDLGGADADFLYSVIIWEELAKAGINISVGLHNDIVAPYLFDYGTTGQRAGWLPKCTTGETVLAIAMTEPEAGSDLQAIRTTAIKDGDEYVLNGQKTFITNAISCDLVVVVCKTDPQAEPPHQGISLLVVEDGTAGFTKGRKLQKMGLHSQDTGELYFENCRVSAQNLLGEEGKGFYYLMRKLQQERLVASLASQGIAERILEDAINYAKQRKAFGKPIGNFQHNAFKLAERATDVKLGRTFIDSLVEKHLKHEEIVTEVSMAKYWIAEMVNKVAYDCLQIYGGYGYMEEYPIARYYRDVRVHSIFAGSSEIMKLLISRQLGL